MSKNRSRSVPPGAVVRLYRQRHGMTVAALARRIGIDHKTLNAIESGRGTRYLKVVEAVADWWEDVERTRADGK